MSEKRDYYEVLGVSKGSDAKALKSAYKKLAVKYHPDKNPGDAVAEEKFKEAAEAYDVLSDPQKKAQYDQFGHAGMQGMGGGGGAGFSNFEDIFSNFGDIFGDMFGGGGRRRRGPSGPPRGEDLQIKLGLTLSEIYKGATKKVKLKRYASCDTCSGQGGSGKQTCSTCGGVGQVRQTQNSLFGAMVNVTTCPDCGGTGSTFRNRCGDCHGQGRVTKEVTIAIDIPAGVAEGNYLTLRGEGHRGPNGGAAGDLIAIIQEKEDENFERREADLFCTVEVPYHTVALGSEIRVQTLEGDVSLKIPAGTQSEKLLRLRGKGLPRLNGGGKGDQYVKVHVHTPSSLSSREKELIEELKALHQEKEEPESFFSKAKSFFS
jgi:molecular chaperone DnaJ